MRFALSSLSKISLVKQPEGSYIYMPIEKPPLKDNELPWIEAGYELFSQFGPDALIIERLAKKTGISKSSFYHHFADISIFSERLLSYHLHKSNIMAQRASLCRNMVPDMAELIIELKSEILFNRQLRIHRGNMAYQLCFERSVTIVEDALLMLWADMLGLKDQTRIAQNILNVARYLFYHRMTNENLTYEWVVAFIEEIKIFLKEVVKSSGVYSQIH